jgi:hypothetical protein
MMGCYEHENERTDSLKASNIVNSFNHYQNIKDSPILTRYLSIPPPQKKTAQNEDGQRMALKPEICLSALAD